MNPIVRPEDFARAWALAATGQPDQPVIQIECRRQSWGWLRAGRSVKGGPLCLAGKTYAHGLGAHADSEIVLRSGAPMTRLRAMVGINDNREVRQQPDVSPLRFAVSAAGTELWRSADLGKDDPPALVDVALPPGTSEVALTVTSIGAWRCAHADWAGLVVTSGGREVAVGSADPGTPLAHQPLPINPPFAMTLDGRAVGELLPAWQVEREAPAQLPGGVTQRHVTWRDPASGLACRLELRQFAGFAAVEWVLHVRNDGAKDSPLIEHLQSLSASWRTEDDALLCRSRGSPCRIDDFEYLVEPLPRGSALDMAGRGGRPSDTWLPFFNLQTGPCGVIAAIGWSGQWCARYSQTTGGWLGLGAGIENIRLRLHPGEEIRTPRILMLFWDGDRITAHNTLRRFLLEHHTPRPNGRTLVGPLTVAHWGGMRTSEHLGRIAIYGQQRLAYDYYWMDAGWYGPDSGYCPDEFTGDWWKHVGNWGVNPKAHPDGIRPISDAAAKAGMKFLVWFEPERAVCGTPLTMEHPEWFLGQRKETGNLLFNLGNPEARQWMTQYMIGLLDQHGIGLYRQDFNFDPLPYWRGADAPDRQGMTEIRYVEGHYAFWDALLARVPGLVIDNCASGGRRIDLETISRSIPLWRSDWQCRPDNDPIGGQVHGMGLSYWIPLHGTGTWGARLDDRSEEARTYRCRSNMGPAFQFSLFPYEYSPVRADYPYDWHRRMLQEYRRARPIFAGDYYPLTSTQPAPDAWAAYQMHRAQTSEGFVMAFRRESSPFVVAQFKLAALDRANQYELEDADTGRRWTQSGEDLLSSGLRIEMQSAPCSRLVFYRRP